MKKKLGGTNLNDLYQSYNDRMNKYTNEFQEIAKLDKNKNYVKPGSPKEKKHIEIGKYSVNFKKNNINNLVGQYFFEKQAGKIIFEGVAYPSKSIMDSAFFIVYNAAPEKYKQKQWIKEHFQTLEKLKDPKLTQSKLKNKLFTDFTSKDINGRIRKISEYLGKSKYVLLDFWASCCGPCIGSIPNLKKIHEKYDRQTLQIVGISLDIQESQWINAIKKHKMSWTQLIISDRKLENQFRDVYGFAGIPYWVLIDDKGKIVDFGISVQELEIRDLNKKPMNLRLPPVPRE